MVSVIGGLAPNHYQRLGIGPGASRAEIEQAFTRRVSSFAPHSLGQVAEASVAFETLKDPAKRRAYDRSIGIRKPEQAPKPLWSGRPWSVTAGREIGARPLGAPALGTPALGAWPPAAPPASAPDFAVANPEPKSDPAPLSVATLGGPARPLVVERPALSASSPAFARSMPVELIDEDQGMVSSLKTALVAGSFIVGVAVVGGWLGWAASDHPAAGQAAGVSAALPRAVPQTADTIAVAEPIARAEARPAARIAQIAATKPKPKPAQAAPERLPAELDLGPAQAAEAVPAEALSESVEAPAATASAAAMPLSNAAVARTIERIGYVCGKVASTVAGAAGVFIVTCTSGQSYRATPIRGRYHFKRMSSH